MQVPRLALCALLLSLPASNPIAEEGEPPARELVWYVEAGADTGGDGSAARPFRYPAEALAALRAQRRREGEERTAPAPLAVVLGEGTWELDATLRLDRECSGTPAAPTTLRGGGRGTRLVGGRVLPPSSFRSLRDEQALARLPGDEARAAVRTVNLDALGIDVVGALAPRGMGRTVAPAPSELFHDGRPLVRARWPNEGFATVAKILDPGSRPRQQADDIPAAERETGPPRGGAFRFDAERVQRWATAPDPWMFGYWCWDWADELLPVARIDPEAGDVHLAVPHRYGLRDGARFRVTNLLEELDTPGEYHVDASARVLYVWPPEDPARGEYVLSLLPGPLVHLDDCRHVVVRDLSLEAGRGMAVHVAGGEDVVVEGCVVANSGTFGIDMSGRRQTVQHCELTRLGAAGVVLRGGDRETLTPAGNRVLDCEIHDFGRTWRTYQPAISLSGVGNEVRHNHLHDAPHSAIIFGGNDHRIERNQIHDVLLETGDCGAIYTGRDWTTHGNVIRNNLIHDLPGSSDRWQNAVYLDDMASGITVEGNIFFRCNSGMLVGGGRHITIRHNLFLDCPLGLRFDARGVGWMAKHIADPSTSTLHRNLRAMPIDRAPWSERFPELQETLTVGFGRPVGSSVVDNAFVRTPFGHVQDREMVQVENNAVTQEAIALFAVAPGPDDRAFSFAAATFSPPGMEGSPPLPVGSIGVRAR